MIFLFLKIFSYPHLRTLFHWFLERVEGWEWNINVREKHWLVASHPCPDWGLYATGRTGDWTISLSMCADWELNPQAFSYRTMLQPTEPHRPGWNHDIFKGITSFSKIPICCLLPKYLRNSRWYMNVSLYYT